MSNGMDTATYIISTSSILETAAGYWTFDDPSNLFAGIVGEDLIPVNGGYPDSYEGERGEIAAADGPTADNGAIYVPMHNWVKCLHGIAPNGVDTAKR
ncbi:MAG: hypothetical protein LBK97_05225, partial [Prevotellaceae bacterium]|nr:hypothetical protein [Prevotellaceae bacterium]